jgi:hypothetical protein
VDPLDARSFDVLHGHAPDDGTDVLVELSKRGKVVGPRGIEPRTDGLKEKEEPEE